MFFLRIYTFSRLNYLLSLILLLSLVSCSGGDGDSTSNPAPTSVIDVINVLGLNWTAPSEREDGSALALSEISGYRIYYGTEAGDYQNQIEFYIENGDNNYSKIILSTQKDPYWQISSLQDFFKTAKINNRQVKLVDLSINHPYATFKNN